MPSPHEHPAVVLIITGAIGAIAAFLVDSAGLVAIALVKADEGSGPDTVFGASVTTVESYLLLAAAGVGLLAAVATWRRLRPRALPEVEEEGEAERVR